MDASRSNKSTYGYGFRRERNEVLPVDLRRRVEANTEVLPEHHLASP
jgi:hypothetical protein